jgi:hypothetical protein
MSFLLQTTHAHEKYQALATRQNLCHTPIRRQRRVQMRAQSRRPRQTNWDVNLVIRLLISFLPVHMSRELP